MTASPPPVTLRRLLNRNLALTLLAGALVLVVVLGFFVERAYVRVLENHLAGQAQVAALRIADLQGATPGPTPARWAAEAKSLARHTGARITLIEATGRVLADSQESPAVMDNHAGRAEVAAALQGRTGISHRSSPTLGRDMLYVAVPVEGGPVAVLRLALSLAQVHQAVMGLSLLILAVTMGMGGLIFVAASYQIRRVTKPLEQVTDAAAVIAAGDLDREAPVSGPAEVQALARSVNHMSAALADRIGEISQSRDLLQAVLTSLPIGVLVFAPDGSLLDANPAAVQLLALDWPGSQGRHYAQGLRGSRLETMVADALAGSRSTLPHLTAPGQDEILLGATAVPGPATGVGAVLLVQDVTAAHRVEAMRRDLIANISHELRTPVTAIRGFAETLLGGALAEPQEARRFSGIILQEAKRLEALTQDMIDLARLQSDPDVLKPGRHDLATLAQEVVDRHQPKAQAGGIILELQAPPHVPAWFDRQRLDQVLTNLLNNSLQYTPRGGTITVTVEPGGGGGARLAVADTGPGIPPGHLPRIFERFYRVEAGRSRTTGGTGLGLAIVKHIVEAHGGRVRAESQFGRGTRIIVELPPQSS